MDFFGLMRLTLLDYPGHVACTFFTGGCNFRCPFCHNTPIVMRDESGKISEREALEFLIKRKGVLDAVCISGGEPLLSDGLISFMGKVKSLGYLVKLDTNGSFPKRLEMVIKSGFCDYVAMDIKNSLEEYSKTAGIEVDTSDIKKSIDIIRNSGIEHEFRTTVVKKLHSVDGMESLAQLIENEEKYFIQSYRENENVLVKGLSAFSGDELQELLKAARKYVPKAELRGV